MTIQSEKFRKVRKQLEHYYKETKDGNLEAYYSDFILAIDKMDNGTFRAWAGGNAIEKHTEAHRKNFKNISEAKEYLARKVVEFS